MRRIYEIGVLLLLLLTMMSCRQRDIMAEAEQQTAALRDALERDVPMDSIRAIAEQREDICFYIFDARQMVYWSSNRLASDAVYLTNYDT